MLAPYSNVFRTAETPASTPVFGRIGCDLLHVLFGDRHRHIERLNGYLRGARDDRRKLENENAALHLKLQVRSKGSCMTSCVIPSCVNRVLFCPFNQNQSTVTEDLPDAAGFGRSSVNHSIHSSTEKLQA